MSQTFLKKKPKQARAQAVVEAIVTSATRVFRQMEFSQATTNRIAEIAGVSIGSLYQYFHNKDALIGLIIERRVKGQLESLERYLDEAVDRPVEEVLDRLIRMVAEDSLANRPFLKTIYERGVALDRVPVVMQARERACARIEEFLRRHAAERVRTEEISRSVFCLVNAVLGVVSAAVVAPSPKAPTVDDDEALMRELGILARRYLLKP